MNPSTEIQNAANLKQMKDGKLKCLPTQDVHTEPPYQNADEFFHQLNLSKSSEYDGKVNGKLPSVFVRNFPLTRYHHHTLLNGNKGSIPLEVERVNVTQKSQEVMNIKRKKKRSLAEKIEELKRAAPPPKKIDSPKKIECELCKVEFSSNDEYEKHTTSTKHVFKVEMEIGTDTVALSEEKDILKHQTNKKCLFENCGAEFNKPEKFIRHYREHTGLHPYSCTRCDARFKVREDLATHLKRHIGIKNISCEHCGMAFSKSRCLVQHLITKHGEKDVRSRDFKCTECGEAFLSKAAVDRHMRWHTGYRPETCTICGLSFHTKFDLSGHMRIHSGEKPFSCDKCDYKARTSELLRKHSKKHTQDKPYACKDCNYRCNTSSSLKRHSLIHTGKKPYKCPYCNHRCSNIENLRKHIKKVAKHKGLKIYPCPHCTQPLGFSTDDGSQLLMHMKQYHFPNLDLKTASAPKLSGIQVEDNTQDQESENEDEITVSTEGNLLGGSPSLLLRDNDLNQDSLANIQPSNLLPELGLKSTLETLNESDLRCLDTQITNKGDVFLSSMAPLDNNDLCKQGTFGSGPFETESAIHGNTMPMSSQEPTNAVPNTEMNLNQGYLALLVKWPSNQNVEVQQEQTEGTAVPLTLVVNSSPLFLSPVDNTEVGSEDCDNIDIPSIPKDDKTYTTSSNNLELTSQNRATLSTTAKPVTFRSNSDFTSTNKDDNITKIPSNRFMTKSSIHVPNRPPVILTESPEKGVNKCHENANS